MKRAKNVLRLAVQIFLLGALVLMLIVVFRTLNPRQPLAPQPTDQTSSPAYPAPTQQNPSIPYPPPIRTSLAPIITMTPTFFDFLATGTPFPITPFPTLTLQPGPSPTLIPLIEPARDAAGTIVFVAKAGKDANPTFYSLSINAAGKMLTQPAQLSADKVQSDYFTFPSPDGSRLAITGEWGVLHVYDINKGVFDQIILSPVEFFNWFPDNRQILVGGGALAVADPISGEYTMLAAAGYGDITGAAASPDGRFVAFAYDNYEIHSPGLWIVNTNGQNAYLLTKGPRLIMNIAWSPDGKRIAFWGDGWEVIDADGSNRHQVASGIILPQCYFLPPLWSPDNRTLAVVTSQTGDAFCNGWGDDIFKGTNTMLINVESGKARPLLPDGSTGNIDPTWSPDGSQIAFVSNRSGSPEIWVVNADGSDLRQLTENDVLVRFPLWHRAETP